MGTQAHKDLLRGLNRARGDLVAIEKRLRAEAAHAHRAISHIDHCLQRIGQ
jgi:hypothetical protein